MFARELSKRASMFTRLPTSGEADDSAASSADNQKKRKAEDEPGQESRKAAWTF